MTALALFIVTLVIHQPTPKKEGNHIHPLILFPAVNSFTNEQQIIYTACNCPPLSIFTTQNNSLNFTRTNIFFSHSVDLYLVFIVSRVLLPQLELLWSCTLQTHDRCIFLPPYFVLVRSGFRCL